MKMSRGSLSRVLIAAFILMSGLALIPYLDLPETTLGWEQFAGIYSPELEVEPEIGRPGSTFTVTGSNYPTNSLATIYVDGTPVGTVMTDENGAAIVYINTAGGNTAVYNVTMAVDANASATDSFTLDDNAAFIPAPPVPAGPIFVVPQKIHLPMIIKS